MGTGRLGTDHEHAAVEKQPAAAAGGDSLDVQLGGLDAHPGGFGFKDQLKFPAETRDIGGRAPHIESRSPAGGRFR